MLKVVSFLLMLLFLIRMWPEKAQLTIFYGGRTMVFDDFPAEKAKELLQLAGSFEASDAGSEPVNYHNSQAEPFLSGTDRSSTSYCVWTSRQDKTKTPGTTCVHTTNELTDCTTCVFVSSSSSEMPMARKASLQRFLEKRKSRLAAADPYYPGPYFAPKENGIGGKPVEAADHGAPWLAVSSPVLHLN